MDIYVSNQDFETVKIIDGYSSLVWADRYNELGDFELEIGLDLSLMEYLVPNNYLNIMDSDKTMIIEDIEIIEDEEDGSKLRITGSSLECILKRRIVWDNRNFVNKKIEDLAEALINESIINPYLPERRIPNFSFERNGILSNKYLVSVEADYDDTIYEVIEQACSSLDIGFEVILKDGYFVFSLYEGLDRTIDQIDRSPVIFSPYLDNILSGDYMKSTSNYKNVVKCDYTIPTHNPQVGDGEAERSYTFGKTTGLLRREVGFTFSDPEDISEVTSDGYPDYEKVYNESLYNQAVATLKENMLTEMFDGDVEPKGVYKYGQDFFIGDIVEVEDSVGHSCKSRVTEVIISENDGGRSVIPTFTKIDEEEYPMDEFDNPLIGYKITIDDSDDNPIQGSDYQDLTGYIFG